MSAAALVRVGDRTIAHAAPDVFVFGQIYIVVDDATQLVAVALRKRWGKNSELSVTLCGSDEHFVAKVT